MESNLYRIKDLKAGTFAPSWPAPNDAVARRNFEYVVRNTPEMACCVDDYELWFVGVDDDESGDVVGAEKRPVEFGNEG